MCRGPKLDAGNSFSVRVPAAIALNASVGVAIPGNEAMPSSTVLRITSGLQFGETISRPPASCTADTCVGSSTVPAPIRQSCPNAFASLSMLTSGSGELNGTSMQFHPAAISVSATSMARSGCKPRRIATRAEAFGTASARIGVFRDMRASIECGEARQGSGGSVDRPDFQTQCGERSCMQFDQHSRTNHHDGFIAVQCFLE